MSQIHPTAIISENTRIGKNTSIGPYSIIEENVEIGDGCRIDSCVKIHRDVKMGNNNEVYHAVVIGAPPQNLGFDYDIRSGVVIGDNNIFREYFTAHRSSLEGKNTLIGNTNFMMVNSHIAHDCVIGNDNVLVNGVLLAGHVTVGNKSFISGNAAVHQFCKIGDFVMIGGLSRVSQDCPHYAMVVGADMAEIVNFNVVGLRRGGFSADDRKAIKRAYKIMCWSNLLQSEIKEQLKDDPNKHVKRLVEFLEGSNRGICSGKKSK